MAYFPMFVDLEDKEILVVGGGRIAARRTGILLEFGCRITLIAPEIGEEMEKLLGRERLTYIKAEYTRELFTDVIQKHRRPFFVLAAADRIVNACVVRDCRREMLTVNDASHKENCDFYFPGIVKEKDAVIGVTSGGGDHKLAAALSGTVRTFMEETWKA